jgi:hypothetical protein
MPPTGTVPAEILDQIVGADFAPDGNDKHLAVVHRVEHGYRLEYPIGIERYMR